MQLQDMIDRRRSVRSYLAEPLTEEECTRIEELIEDAEPLFADLAYGWRMVSAKDCTTLQKWRNPQFLAIFTDGTDDGLMNAGFVFQQLDLQLQMMGYGTCWIGLGSLNDSVSPPEGMKLALLMAIGKPAGVPQREGAADFKRKAISEISDVPDERLEPLRLAPSATNSQPWFVTHQGDVLHLFRAQWGPIRQRALGRCNKIDMGIGLAHLYAANPDTFCFWREEQSPLLDEYTYVGSVKI